MAGTFPHGNQGIIGAVPLQVARLYVALPAAGAFDPSPTELECMGFDYVILFMTYTRGAAGGAFTIRPEFSPYASDTAGFNWFRNSLYDPDAVVAGSDSTSEFQAEDIKYTSTAAGDESVIYGPILLAGGIQRMRIPAAESGQVGDPGGLEIIAMFF